MSEKELQVIEYAIDFPISDGQYGSFATGARRAVHSLVDEVRRLQALLKAKELEAVHE